ncbi:hypothetical protein BCR44DRAFT_41122 [Catenaria anguillulae PL171]|uniref:Uncharacterized protein n=1 Tax=Catenaria anguillulae PL171 TaxID=765915 RepID=A0A1Y2HFM8_9FUNG|nr:hypothetical protein BCR44DRAFT_41122 [Catenaria anguillulae PL171]
MTSNISERDAQVLDLIFGGGPPVVATPEPVLPPTESPSAKALAALSPSQADQLRTLETQAIQLAEQNQLDSALDHLNQALAICPHAASLYNNRAQVYRLRGKTDLALLDLDKAIELGQGEAWVLKNAHTQRGVVMKQLGDQDKAVSEFELAGKYGSKVGKVAAVKENPFAQMCNAIMDEVMAQYRRVPPIAAPGASAAPPTSQSGCEGETNK